MEEHYKQILFDLVRLAIKTNNVVIQGNFPARIADEVSDLLSMCNDIHSEYVVREEEEE